MGRTVSTVSTPQTPLRTWVAPQLEFKGTVGELLQTGGGKLSLSLADSGESRCEKPHTSSCVPV
jgi:hypothetical protein